MKPKMIYNFKLLPSAYAAITIYPFILFRSPKERVGVTLIRHEYEHFMQARRIGWFSFYLSYLLYYLAGLLRYKSHWSAYAEIPYEIEARRAEFMEGPV